METINFLTEKLHLDAIIMLLVFASGFFQARYLKDLKTIKGFKVSAALKTLAVSFVFSAIYLLLLHVAGSFQREDAVLYFTSYCVATSFYELMIKPFMERFKIDVSA